MSSNLTTFPRGLLCYAAHKALDRCWTILFLCLSSDKVFQALKGRKTATSSPFMLTLSLTEVPESHQFRKKCPLYQVFCLVFYWCLTSLSSLQGYNSELWVLGWWLFVNILPFHAQTCPSLDFTVSLELTQFCQIGSYCSQKLHVNVSL